MKILPTTVIYFHEVHDQKWFINALELLLKNYHIIGLQELEDFYYHNRDIKNCCHITFDDGDITFYKNVFPVIKKYKVPVSLYVSPLIAQEGRNFWFQEIRGYDSGIMLEIIRKVGNKEMEYSSNFEVKELLKTFQIETILEIIKIYQKETMTFQKMSMNMNIDQLNEVKSSGLVEIGAHTLNHPILTNETYEAALNEIKGSIDLLSNILKSDIKYFVYPNGNYSDREINILKDSGIKLAFTTERGKISHLNNTYSIPRSGSPFVSQLNNKSVYIFSKCLVQLLAGENRYYKYADTWSKLVSRLN